MSAISFRTLYCRYFKYILDAPIALILIFFLMPLFLFIAIKIKLTSHGPIIFRQKRVGLRGREFMMLKFRSMVIDAEQLQPEVEAFNIMNGPAFKMKDDPRTTRFGKFLRRTSLDEFPQLWNVFKGDMSLVGPRPLVTYEVAKYDLACMRRFEVKPGLTCLWQVNGRSHIMDFDKWLKLDLEYIDNLSPGLDMKILLKTIPVVLSGFGAL